jgi:tRNA wybutosine-synthesizing protein 4
MQVYEQILPDCARETFGRQMIQNLEERGAPLHGVHSTPTLEAHKQRLVACGWERAFAEDMLTLYRHMLHPKDRSRIEMIQMLDEFVEWDLMMSHYCISVGVKDKLGVLHQFDFKLDKSVQTVPSSCASEAGVAFKRPSPNAD